MYNVFAGDIPKKSPFETNVFAEFLQTKGLYDRMEINENNINDLIILLDGQVKINTYCPECKSERVFTMEPCTFFVETGEEYILEKLSDEVHNLQKSIYSREYREKVGESWQWKNWKINEVARVIVFKYMCAMEEEHHLDYIVLTSNNSFVKIGQYPTITDLTYPMLEEYKNVMSKEDRKEFGRAIGLFASGIGVGSYVYLRRIFERILLRAKEKAEGKIDEVAFETARVNEKIEMLRDFLPSILVENPTLYGILSKGIHHLSEEECLTFFPVVKDCIFMILNEWEKMRKREEQEKSISVELSKIASAIKKDE